MAYNDRCRPVIVPKDGPYFVFVCESKANTMKVVIFSLKVCNKQHSSLRCTKKNTFAE